MSISVLDLAVKNLDEQQIIDNSIPKLNEDLKPYGWKIVKIQESLNNNPKSVVKKKKKKVSGVKGKKVPVKIHGVTYDSKTEACEKYNITQTTLNKWIKLGINLDDKLAPVKDTDEFLIQDQKEIFLAK